MRIRQTTSSLPKTWTNHYTQWNNSSSPTAEYDQNEVFQTDVQSKYMEDVVVPGYRKLIARGAILNNPMYKTESFEKLTGGTTDMGFVQDNGGGRKTGFTVTGNWMTPIGSSIYRYLPAPSSINVQQLQDIAITDAHYNASVNEMEILATMAEMKETVNSLISIFGRVAKIATALKKLNFRVLKKQLSPKELADRYMEARYAIRPMYYDAMGVIAALQKKLKHSRFTSRGGRTESDTVSDLYLIRSNTYYEVWVRRETVITVSVRAGVLADIEDLTQLQVWGADRLLTSTWEVVPLSFVLDWFFNVGKTIGSWQPSLGRTILASWIVVTTTTIQSCRVDHCVAKWPTSSIIRRDISHDAMSYKTTVTKQRSVNPNLPVLPSFDVKLDALKLLDLGMIIRNWM